MCFHVLAFQITDQFRNNQENEDEIQKMQAILNVENTTVLAPPLLPLHDLHCEIRTELHEPPFIYENDSEPEDKSQPTLKAAAKANTPAANRKRRRSVTDVVEVESVSKKKKRVGRSDNKENKPAKKIVHEVDDADVFLVKGRSWSVEDKTKLFEWFLGPDADEIFNIHKTNPDRAYRKVFLPHPVQALANVFF
jgi:hypothetical protein